jgi:hypothetical protein
VNRAYNGRLGLFTPPTQHMGSVKFDDWLKLAHAADAHGIEADESHHYLMLGVAAGREVARNEHLSQFVSGDLESFATTKNNFFVSNVKMNKGIQCRFGMKGVIAEAHYDGGRNMVAMLKGAKRYILAPPASCKILSIIKVGAGICHFSRPGDLT